MKDKSTNTDNQMVKKDMLINKLILQVEKLLDKNVQSLIITILIVIIK